MLALWALSFPAMPGSVSTSVIIPIFPAFVLMKSNGLMLSATRQGAGVTAFGFHPFLEWLIRLST